MGHVSMDELEQRYNLKTALYMQNQANILMERVAKGVAKTGPRERGERIARRVPSGRKAWLKDEKATMCIKSAFALVSVSDPVSVSIWKLV